MNLQCTVHYLWVAYKCAHQNTENAIESVSQDSRQTRILELLVDERMSTIN